MAKRIVNRRELRAEYEAAEAREQERKKKKGDEEEDLEGGEEEAAEAEEEEAPKKKKPAAKEAKPKRSRAPKVVRQRMVWVVCDNSHKQVGESFPYPRRKDAEDLAARLSAEKKSTYFVQPKKEDMKE
jgi:hypothetical protein